MKLTNEQLSKIAELAGWKKGSLGLWDDGMKLHTLLELESLDVLISIAQKIPKNFNWGVEIELTHFNPRCTLFHCDTLETVEQFECESLVEALQLALLKYVEAKYK